MSVSTENFIKSLFVLGAGETRDVSGSLLAARLEVSSAAVTDMARKLAAKGLVDYAPYKAVKLTDPGREMALKIIRKHRLWELFLHKVLNMDLGSVHAEAECLEHQTSDELTNRLDEFLGFPLYDPHGEPIPSGEGVIREEPDLVSLERVTPGEKIRVSRIQVQDKEIFEMVHHYQIKPGTKIEVLRLFDIDGSMEVKIKGEKVILPGVLVGKIFCKEGKV